MAKIRNDILLAALSSTSGSGPVAGTNAAGRPMINIPLAAGEARAVAKARADSQTAAVTTDEGTAVKTDAAMQRPEFGVQSVDVFHSPEIREVDPSDWHGEVAQVIRIHAVKQPMVVIADGEGRVIEQDAATRAAGDLWTYTTIAPATDGPWLIVTTRALPEHLTEVRFGE
jgi:hypothetical protein